MNCLYEKIIIIVLLVTSIQLQTGYKEIIDSPKIEVKGILKTAPGFTPSDQGKKFDFSGEDKIIPRVEFVEEEGNPQVWQSLVEKHQSVAEVVKSKNMTIEEYTRYEEEGTQAIKDRNVFLLKATRYDDLSHRNYELALNNRDLNCTLLQERRKFKCLLASVGLATITAFIVLNVKKK